MITGHCECGAVRYSARGPITDFSHCHCSMCRRLHGAPYVSFAGVALSQIEWLSGKDCLGEYASSAKNDRFFCQICGSRIAVASEEDPGVIYLALGAVDGSPDLPAGYHQYVDSRAPWLEIYDDLPQFSGPYEDT